MSTREQFTSLWSKYILRVGPISEIEQYESHGISNPVYWVESDKVSFRGQTTIFGTIVLNRTAMERMGAAVLDYAFLHEIGHTRNSFVWKIIAWLRPVYLALPLYLTWQFSYPIWTVPLGIGLAWIVWILDELLAERFAAVKLGKEKFLESKDLADSHSSDLSIPMKYLKSIAYPPAWLTLRTI